MRKISKILVGLAMAANCYMAIPAQAQFEPLINPLVRTTIPQVIQCPGCNKAQKQNERPPARPSAKEAAALRFTPDAAIRKATVSQFASNVLAQDPNSTLASFLATGDPLGGMDRRMTALGLSPTNLGDVMTMFIVSQWSYSRGTSTLPSREVVQAVRSQFVASMTAQPGVANMTNAGKQQVADSIMTMTAMVAKAIEDAAGNEQTVQAVASVASETLNNMGFDPEKMTLSDEGMVAVDP